MQHMHQLQPVRAVQRTGQGMGWFQRVVRPLLCPPGALSAALADGAGGHAGLHCAPPARRPYTGGCFAGREGAGCGLSLDEMVIADRVAGEPMSWEVAHG